MTELLGFGNPLYVIDDQYLLLAAGRKVSSSHLQRDTTPENRTDLPKWGTWR